MINISEDTTLYYLDIDPSVGFTLDEFISLEITAFCRVEEQKTPLFCQHKSNVLGDFFVGLN